MTFDPSRIQYGDDQPFQPMPVPIHPGIEAQKKTAEETEKIRSIGEKRLEELENELATIRSVLENECRKAAEASCKTNLKWWVTTIMSGLSFIMGLLSAFKIFG